LGYYSWLFDYVSFSFSFFSYVRTAPLLFGNAQAKSTEELTRDYARNSRYMSSLADAVGQFVLLGNKMSMLKGNRYLEMIPNKIGYTNRVAELLERIENVSTKLEPFTLLPEDPKEYVQVKENVEFRREWKERCDNR
jgi:ABC-type uncharacterized transport system fused permease/ATPase subunit